MSDFLERHGTLVMLFMLFIGMFGVTIWLGLRAHVDGEKLFAFCGVYAAGAWSGLTLAMRVSPSPAPPVQLPPLPLPQMQATHPDKPDNGQIAGVGYKVST